MQEQTAAVFLLLYLYDQRQNCYNYYYNYILDPNVSHRLKRHGLHQLC